MFLTTKRTTIRPVKMSDVNDMSEYTSNENVVSMVGWNTHVTMNDAEELVRSMIQDNDSYSIELNISGNVIGTIGIHKKPANSNLEVRILAIILNPKYWGQNYAYEVTREVLKYLFETEKVHKVNVGHYSFNMQSQKVIQKLGFVYEGTKREAIIKDNNFYDAVEYSMLARDYIKAFK